MHIHANEESDIRHDGLLCHSVERPDYAAHGRLAVGVDRRGGHINYLFRLYQGSVKKDQVVEVLKPLKAHLEQPLLIIWDGARPHRSAMVRQYLDSLDGHIQMTFLPPYCPELNPVEYLWAWLKRHAIANFCPKNPDELRTTRPQQAQRCTTPTLDHHCLLDSGELLVMS